MKRVCGAMLLVLATAVPVHAQVPDAEDPWESARELYRERAFEDAVPYLVEAIHRDPVSPRPYLGLARALWNLQRYDEAVFYYDVYLNALRDRIAADARTQDRVPAVAGERDTVNALRSAPGSSPGMPAAHAEARQAFLGRLESGPIVTAEGGGALALYRLMLRMGYAHPDLVELRQRLGAALLAEATALVADDATALPQASLAEWRAQVERMNAWMALQPPTPATDIPASALDPTAAARDPSQRARAHLRLAEGQIQYLNQSFSGAIEAFAGARSLWPRLLPAWVAEWNARTAGGVVTPEEDTAAFEAAIRAERPDMVAMVDVYRALFDARGGDLDRASATLLRVLAEPPAR